MKSKRIASKLKKIEKDYFKFFSVTPYKLNKAEWVNLNDTFEMFSLYKDIGFVSTSFNTYDNSTENLINNAELERGS